MRRQIVGGALLWGILLLLVTRLLAAGPAARVTGEDYTSDFLLENCSFTTEGGSTYFTLKPGARRVLEGWEDGELVRVVAMVLDQTAVIAGVETRVVLEMETHDGELVEVARNYVVFCEDTASLVYFGEDVDILENGVVVGHDGSWHAGELDARPGILMPGLVTVGARYYQEVAPGVALDRAEHLSTEEVVDVPAGHFEHCLLVEESTPLEPGAREYKLYAPGVGLVRDGVLELVSYR